MGHKELILGLGSGGLTLLQLLLKLLDSQLSEEAELLALLHVVQGLPMDSVDDGVQMPDLALELRDLLLEVFFVLG